MKPCWCALHQCVVTTIQSLVLFFWRKLMNLLRPSIKMILQHRTDGWEAGRKGKWYFPCVLICSLNQNNVRWITTFHLFFRHGITFKDVSGESEKVAKEMTATWVETTLPTILAIYQLKDIFNVDGFGLTKHYHENLYTSEVSVVQVENRAKCSEQGWMRLKPLVTKSQCLWLENLSVQHASSTFATSLADIDLKRWMDGTFFEECLHELDRKL